MKKRWVAFGVVVVVVAGGAVYLSLHGSGNAHPAATVATVATDIGDVTLQVAATGNVEPATTRTLSFSASGTVATVKVRAGSKVAAGDTLATIDDTDAADAVNNAEDSLTKAQTQLTEAEDQSAQATAAAKAAKVSASASAARKTSPSAGSSGSARTQPSASPTAKASNGSGAGAGQQSNSGTDPVYTAQTQVDQARLTLQEAEVTLDGTTITAPIGGTVLSVAGKVGTQVGSGSTFVTLADTYHWQVDASFPEADAGSIKVGQHATVGLADLPGQTFVTTVVQVDPTGTSDGTMVTYGVVLSFTKAPSELLVGQSAQVTITTGDVVSTLRVPTTAVHDVTNGTGTVMVRAGAATVARSVRVGLRGDSYTQITGGLVAGDNVVPSW